MTTQKAAVAIAACLVLVLTGCGGGGGGSDNGVQTGSTGLAIAATYPFAIANIGDLVLFLVDEVEQAETDLNGDGDVADNVVHVLNPQTGEITNLGWASNGTMAGSATLGFFVVPENAQGGMDLNGDMDENDNLLAIYDPSLPVSVTNPRISPMPLVPDTSVVVSGDIAVMVTSEAYLGVNLTPDMDLADEFLVVMDLVNDTSFMTPFASVTGAPFSVGNGIVAFTVDETNHGADVNGNGSMNDTLLYWVSGTGGALNVVGPGFGRHVHPNGFGIAGTEMAPFLIYSVDEAAEQLNLNGNGLVADVDEADFVVALWNVNGGVESFPGGGLAVQPRRLGMSSTRVSFSVAEMDNGPSGTDLNSDFDTNDVVPFWSNLAVPGFAENVGIAQDSDESSFFPFLCDEFLVVMAPEADQGANGTNYNARFGDTDVDDQVPFFIDIRTPNVVAVNLEYACTQFICSSRLDRWIIIVGDEAANNGVDLNGYSAGTDLAPGYIPVTANNQLVLPPVFTRIDGNITVQECPEAIRLLSFSKEGVVPDYWRLNNDDDIEDWGLVITRIDKAARRVSDITIAGTVNSQVAQNSFPIVINQTSTVFPADELIYGTGVNANAESGDTDLFDTILNYASFRCF